MYGNVMRMSGLTTGLDTQAMVRQLMNAENLKMNKLKQKRQLLEWKQTAYRDVAKVLGSFQTSMLNLTAANSLRMPSTYTNFTTAVTMAGGAETSAVKASAGGGIKEAKKFSIDVYSVAKGDVYVSGTNQLKQKLFSDTNTIDESELLNMIAKFEDEVNNPTTGDPNKTFTVFTVKLNNGSAKDIVLDASDIAAITAGGTSLAKIQNFVGRINSKLSDPVLFGTGGPKIELEYTVNPGTNGQFNFTMADGHSATIGRGSADANILDKMGFGNGGSTTYNITLAQADWPTSSNEGSITINGKTVTYKGTDTLQSFINKVNKTANIGVKMTLDGASLKMESTKTGEIDGKIDITAGDLTKMGFTTTLKDSASDAIIEYNDKTYISANNQFTINGVDITLTDEAFPPSTPTGGFVTYNIELKSDTSAVADTIRKFVEEYNKLVEILSGLYSTPRPRSGTYNFYEPLTDDEKAAMKEREVEMWEEKAKTGMLYRDDIIRSISSNMRTMLYTSVQRTSEGPIKGPNGENTINLTQIGITTSDSGGYIGKLQINEKKLQAALENDMEGVRDLFTKSANVSASSIKQRNARLKNEGIGDRLDDIIRNAIDAGGTIYSKAGLEGNTFSNNTSEMYKLLKQQDDKIASMMKYLFERENYYYAMFSRMENAVAKSNTQMESLLSMLA